MKHGTLARLARLLGVAAALPNDPVYGIRRDKITAELTTDNWQHKGLWRICGSEPVYIFVRYGRDIKEPGSDALYTVNVRHYSHSGEEVGRYSAFFVDLSDALDYANGKGLTPLSALTRVAAENEYPDDSSPAVRVLNPQGVSR